MENKKRNILLIIGILVILLVVSGATYAFLKAQVGSTGNDEVNVTTSTTDSLAFEVGAPIDLVVGPEDFKNGGKNQVRTTTATATLKANNATNAATEHYYLYLNIKNNEFKHVISATQAELVLTVEKKNADDTYTPITITSFGELKTFGTGEKAVTGYDITEVNGLIEIANTNIEVREGDPEATKIDEYKVAITLVNLDADQNENTGKKFNAELIMQKEEIKTLAGEIKKLYTTDGANGLYHFDGSGGYTNGYLEADDGSYRYVGADYVINTENVSRSYYHVTSFRENELGHNIINFYCMAEGVSIDYVGPGCLKSYNPYFTVMSDSNHYGSLSEALTVAETKGYIQGDQIKNYVCFGSDEETCPEENLYRIIGVFGDQVKLIKAYYATKEDLGDATVSNDYYGEHSTAIYSGIKKANVSSVYFYYWNKDQTITKNGKDYKNEWSTSNLNKLHLNDYYLNQFSEKWQDMIAPTYWKTGRPSQYEDLDDTSQSEMRISSNYLAKIGLMYLNDYMYANDPKYWKIDADINYSSFPSYNYSPVNSSWIYGGLDEWTIMASPSNDSTIEAYSISKNGNIVSMYVLNTFGVRPVFYLKSNVTLTQGTGLKSDPYRIA